ncbi:MAG: flagellar biosynthesis protein FlhF, partial [Treponemataceae bacterium]
MEYFTEQAPSHSECMRKIRTKYGEGARVLMQRSVRIGGVLGFFTKEAVEMSGVVGTDSPRPSAVKKAPDLEEEKKKFISNLKGEQTLQLVLNEVRGLKEK